MGSFFLNFKKIFLNLKRFFFNFKKIFSFLRVFLSFFLIRQLANQPLRIASWCESAKKAASSRMRVRFAPIPSQFSKAKSVKN